MATDIAFALGVLALLGKRVSPGVRGAPPPRRGRDRHLRPADSGPLAIADYPVDAVTVFPGSDLVARDRLFVVDAAAGGLTGYHAFAGGGLYHEAGEPPAAFGTQPAIFANIGGTRNAAGAIPFIEPSNGAAIVVSQ